MRINAFVALATGVSRREADNLIKQGKVRVNNQAAALGMQIEPDAIVSLNRERLSLPAKTTTILLNKPVGFVVSRKGQGAKTIYDLLPVDLSSLKPVGRLDKDSSGLIMLTNDGLLANSLTHPSMNKQKLYLVSLDKPLAPRDLKTINDGIRLSDGVSHLTISDLAPDSRSMNLNMVEGRNRQIRRTFESLGYKVIKLHRVQFGQFRLNDLESGRWFEVKN